MASICGLNIKSYKEFKGEQGIDFTFSLYLGEKRVAKCTKRLNESNIDISFLNKKNIVIVENVISECYEKFNINVWNENRFDCVLEELLRLVFIEKFYIASNKKKTAVIVDVRCNNDIPVEAADVKKDFLIALKKWDEKEEQKLIKKYQPIQFKVYNSMESFILM